MCDLVHVVCLCPVLLLFYDKKVIVIIIEVVDILTNIKVSLSSSNTYLGPFKFAEYFGAQRYGYAVYKNWALGRAGLGHSVLGT